MGSRSRLARWRGLVGIAVRRVVTRSTRTDRTQTWLSVTGVAVSVALMLLVTSVGVGLAGQSMLTGSSDYTIVPESGPSSVITDVESARLGGAHGVSDRLAAREDVSAATPVRTVAMRVSVEGNDPVHLLVIGIVPSSDMPSIAGLATDELTPGDPHFANGTYEGPWTGELVLSDAGADALGAMPGDEIRPANDRTNRSFAVTAVRSPERAGVGQFPVALVHLSELQTVVGGTTDDAADQIVVVASDPGVEDHLESIYPRSTVVSRGDLFGAGSRTELPFAISVTAFVIAVAVGTLFTMTTLGFELAAGSTERAVMGALGISRRSRAAIIAIQTLFVAVLGGLVGVLLWLAGLVVANALATAYLTDLPVAVFRAELAAYGLAVAVLIGMLTLPYLLFVSSRTSAGDRVP